MKQAEYKKRSSPRVGTVSAEQELVFENRKSSANTTKDHRSEVTECQDAASEIPVIWDEGPRDELDGQDGEDENICLMPPSRGGMNNKSQEPVKSVAKGAKLLQAPTKRKSRKHKDGGEHKEAHNKQDMIPLEYEMDVDEIADVSGGAREDVDIAQYEEECDRSPATDRASPSRSNEATERDNGDGITPGRSSRGLRQRVGRPSARSKKTTKTEGDSTPSSYRTEGRSKEIAGSAVVMGNEEEQERVMGFSRIPTKAASAEDLNLGLQADELDPNPSSGMLTGRKRMKGAKISNAIVNDKVPLRVPSRVPASQTASELGSKNDEQAHAQALQSLLEKEPDLLTKLKACLLEGLTSKRRLRLVNLEDEHHKVHQLVEQTVLAGEGNSMLVIGSRGSGKTTLVETVISELASAHRDDFHVVRLNGFIHVDDKLALREIWRQLGREMEVEDDIVGGRGNYADTLTSLLALLSHPAQEEDQAATARSVIFILDEFDLFASHPRQTLLYNLFDVAQTRNAPIAVLGLTTKVNVVDSLEKRVKSRFGQRYVHLSLPKTFTAFQDICLSALSYHPTTEELLQSSNAKLSKLSVAWNDQMSHIFHTPHFRTFLQTLYARTKSVPAFFSASLLPIAALSPTNIPTPAAFASHPLHPPDSKLALLPSLSTLELALLISAARLDVILDTDVCTFAMAYDEYVALAGKSKLQSAAAGQVAVGGGGARVWGKAVAKGAWEHLVGLELVLPAAGAGRGAGRGEIWRVDVGLEEVGVVLEGMDVPGKWGLGKWCREI